jgi:hypothetical protein
MLKQKIRGIPIKAVIAGSALLILTLVLLNLSSGVMTKALRGITNAVATSPSTTKPLGPLSPAQAASAPPVTVSPVPANGGHAIDAATALAEARSDPSVTNITQSFAKMSTWGAYLADTDAGSATRANLTPANQVIVTAVVGTVQCNCSLNSTLIYSWKMVAFDQASGATLAVHENNGPLPSWFTDFPDAK